MIATPAAGKASSSSAKFRKSRRRSSTQTSAPGEEAMGTREYTPARAGRPPRSSPPPCPLRLRLSPRRSASREHAPPAAHAPTEGGRGLSSSLPHVPGRPLLQERLHAFPHVLGGREEPEQVRLQRERLVHGGVVAEVHRLERQRHGDRAVREDLAQERLRGGPQLALRHHPVDEA